MKKPQLSNGVLRLTIATLFLFAATSLYAADNSSRDLAMVDPAEVGMDKAKLDELGSAMRQVVDDGKLSGVITAVAHKGKIVHWQTYGKQDIEAGTPMAKDTIFRIYSMTKPTVGVALMTLYEEGKFKLSDPVEKYIPELANLKVAKEDGPDGMPVTEDADHPMTIRELVSHTGGLTYGLFSRGQVDTLYMKANILDLNQTLKEFVGKLGKIPLRQQPGTLWHYSVSVDVQGYLVEVLSGKPLDVYLEETLFGPLGMKDTGFWVKPENHSRLAAMYSPNRQGELVAQTSTEYLTKPNFFSGGGGLASTTMDYLRFAQMLLNGGELDGVRILEPETVEMMHTNQLPDGMESISPMISTPGNQFGIDFSLVTNPDGKTDHALAKGEYWWYGYGGTWFGINPVQDLIVVGMIQSIGGGGARQVRFESKKLAYSAIVDPVVSTTGSTP